MISCFASVVFTQNFPSNDAEWWTIEPLFIFLYVLTQYPRQLWVASDLRHEVRRSKELHSLQFMRISYEPISYWWHDVSLNNQYSWFKVQTLPDNESTQLVHTLAYKNWLLASRSMNSIPDIFMGAHGYWAGINMVVSDYCMYSESIVCRDIVWKQLVCMYLLESGSPILI